MTNEIETCRQCRHQTGDLCCSNEHTRDKDGSMFLSRHAWHVTRPGESCHGKYFELKPSAISCSASSPPAGTQNSSHLA